MEALAHPVYITAFGVRTSHVVISDRAHLARYMARKARDGFTLIGAGFRGPTMAVQIARGVICTEDYRPGVQWTTYVQRAGTRYVVHHWTDTRGCPQSARRAVGPSSKAPVSVLATIERMARPCTLDPRELASFGDSWNFTYERRLHAGDSVESANRMAWALTKAELIAYFDGCETVPDIARPPLAPMDITTRSARDLARPHLLGRTLAEVIDSGTLANIDAELVHAVGFVVATFSELKPHALTPEGARYWADVLALRVCRVTDYYDVPMLVFGDENDPRADYVADRFQAFTWAYAGYVSETEYNAWFTDGVDQ